MGISYQHFSRSVHMTLTCSSVICAAGTATDEFSGSSGRSCRNQARAAGWNLCGAHVDRAECPACVKRDRARRVA